MIAESKCNIDFIYDGAEKNCRGIEESRMERSSDDNSIFGGPPADSDLTCIFRLAPSLFRRMNIIVSTSENATNCCKSRTPNVDVLKKFSSLISQFPWNDTLLAS